MKKFSSVVGCVVAAAVCVGFCPAAWGVTKVLLGVAE